MKKRDFNPSTLLFVSSLPLYIIFAKVSFNIYQYFIPKSRQLLNNDHKTFNFFCVSIWFIILYLFNIFMMIREIDKSIIEIKNKKLDSQIN